MSFYIFKFEKIHVKNKRGNIPDKDLVTFSILVNQVDRGHGAGVFPAVVDNRVYSTNDNSVDGLPAYRVTNGLNISKRWAIGPIEIKPEDSIHVIYTATNISDEGLTLSTQERDEIILKIYSAVFTAAIGALTGGLGLVGKAVSGALGAIENPVKTLLGYKVLGPCNGPVFSGAVKFNGGGLDNLHLTDISSYKYPSMSFTNTHTNEDTHDATICGHMAVTDVTFLVSRVPFISLKDSLGYKHALSQGLRKPGQKQSTISLKSLLGLRP